MSWSAAPNPFRGAAKNFLSVLARTLGANGVDTYMLPGTQPGPAQFFFGAYDSSGFLLVNIRPTFHDGTFGAPVFLISGTSTPINTKAQANSSLYLPNYNIQVVVQNTDGAAPHEYDLGLWPVGGTF